MKRQNWVKEVPMFQIKPQLDENFLGMDEFARLLHKQPSFGRVLREFVKTNMQNETIEIETPLGKKEVPVFYYGAKKSNRATWYILKDAMVPFLKRHMDTFEKLGIPLENLLAATHKIPVMIADEKAKSNLISLWDVATKCSYNTKILTSISKEIKRVYLGDTFLTTDLVTGKQVEKPMFVFVKHKMGQSGVFMLKDALPFFLEKNKQALKNFASLLEQSNEHLSLRSFSRYLGTSKYEPELLSFIQKHIDETFKKEDNDGQIQTYPIFSYQKQTNGVPVLNIHKEGAQHFITKYQKELIQIGFKGVQALLHNFDKKGFQKGYLSIREITSKLHKNDAFSKELTALIHQKFAQDQVIEVHPKTKQQTSRNLFFSRYQKQMIYFIKETDFALFVNRYKNILLQLGAEEKIINHILKKDVIPHKDNDMVTFRDFMRLIRRNNISAQDILNEIKANHLDDTYEKIDELGHKTKEPIFVYAKNSTGFSYYFANKKAMHAFFKQQKEMLTQKFGIKEEIINSILGKQKVQPYNPQYIFITKLLNELHIHHPHFTNYIKAHHLTETYPVVDEQGNISQQPMFIFMAAKASGIGNYAIHKKALAVFAKRYQEKFNIKDEVINSLENETPLVKKEKSFLTITQLAKFLNKSTIFANALAQKIKAHYLEETALAQTTEGVKNIPVFSKAFTKTGSITIYADTRALPSFLKKHKQELEKLGIKEKSIENLISMATQNPFFHVPHLLKEKVRSKQRLQAYYAIRQKD